MAQYKVLTATNSEEMRHNIRTMLNHEEDLALVGFSDMDTSILTKIAGYAPHVVLLAQDENDKGVMELAERIYQGFPGCGVVLLSDNQDMALLNKAMKVGIRQVLPLDDIDKLKDTLIEAAVFEQCRTIETGRQPRIISVYGGAGGCGKTTIAINLAIALAQNGGRVALIDLCLHYGDVALLLNLDAKDTISELVQEKSDFTIEEIKNFCMLHSSGLNVLCAPSSPKYAEYITPKHVESLVNLMRPYYEFVIIDLPCELSECTISAIESSDDILLVNKRDIQNLRASKLMMDILNTLHQSEKVKLVVNCDRNDILKDNDFQRVLDLPVIFSIPEDVKTARKSQAIGVPFILEMPKSSMSKGIKKIEKYFIEKYDRRYKEDRRKANVRRKRG